MAGDAGVDVSALSAAVSRDVLFSGQRQSLRHLRDAAGRMPRIRGGQRAMSGGAAALWSYAAGEGKKLNVWRLVAPVPRSRAGLGLFTAREGYTQRSKPAAQHVRVLLPHGKRRWPKARLDQR